MFLVMVFGCGCGFWLFLAWVRCFWLWFSVVVVVFVLKGVVGRGWVRGLGRGWVVAEVGCWSWIGEASHGLSLISHRGSASWVWIGGLGLVDGGFEMVDLLIGGWIGLKR